MNGSQLALAAVLLGAACSHEPAAPDGGSTREYSWSRFAAAPPSETPGRFGMPLVLLEENRAFVGFGGSHQPLGPVEAATWMFSMDDQAWTRTLDLVTPLARYGHCATYLPLQNEMLLVGGRDEDGLLPAEAWTYQIATRHWSRVVGAVPTGAVGCVAVWMPPLSQALVYGGYGASGTVDDTWSYDPNTRKFTRLSPPTSPVARFDAHAAWDSLADRVLLFGGASGTPGAPTVLADLWSFDGGVWKELSPTSGPPPRRGGAHAFVAEDADWIFFGGAGEGRDLGDTWIYHTLTGSFTELPREGGPEHELATGTPWLLAPSPRAFASSGYDRFARAFILFGGFSSAEGVPSSEGWRLTWSAPNVLQGR